MGYQGLGDDSVTGDPTPVASPPGIQPPPLTNPNGNPCKDPIWTFSKEEMVRLCRVYEEEMGLMYPVINIEDVIIHGKNCKKDHALLGVFLSQVLTANYESSV